MAGEIGSHGNDEPYQPTHGSGRERAHRKSGSTGSGKRKTHPAHADSVLHRQGRHVGRRRPGLRAKRPCWPETAWTGLGGGGGGLERPPGYAGQSRPCRPVQANAGRSRPCRPVQAVQANAGRSRPVQANAGQSRPVQANAGQSRPMQAGPGQCRPIQAGLGQFRQLFHKKQLIYIRAYISRRL